jgi:hypothetical protein
MISGKENLKREIGVLFMIFKEILPSLSLQPFVQNYLLVNLTSATGFHIKPYPARIEQALAFFAKRIGIGPKLYSRISRFFQAFQYKETQPDLDWLTVAVQFGYTDYHHLAKDFKQFANATPNLLLKENSLRPEIVVSL